MYSSIWVFSGVHFENTLIHFENTSFEVRSVAFLEYSNFIKHRSNPFTKLIKSYPLNLVEKCTENLSPPKE